MKSKNRDTGIIIVDNHTAELLCRMAEKFYSDPENVKKYNQWHKATYGCLPEGVTENDG